MGNRMTPNGTNFDFLRLLAEQGANSTSKVPFARLQHIFNVDNRPVYADIEDLRLNGVASSLECQFMSGTGSSTFLSLIHISEPTRLLSISYAVFCLKK